MASRSDVDIFWNLSPRLIFVQAPSDSITVQDLHDTLRDREQEVANMVYPSIVSSAGKEDLGGGVTVGVTSTLLNARIGFQARKVWVSTGTVTTPDATGVTLIDGYATFVTDGVEPGAWIVNLDDGSICTALTVDSETQISTDTLGGGTLNEFVLADRYQVMNVTQCEIDGGNLVATDVNGDPLNVVFPTAGTQVVRTSASSATRVSQLQLEHSTFNGTVTVDAVNGTAGTLYPIGTEQTPVNNIPQAVQIANTRGFSKINIVGNITLDTGDDLSDFIVFGQNPSKTLITVNAGAVVTDIQIHDATVTGAFDVTASFIECHLQNVSSVQANIHACILEGTLTLAGAGQTSLYDCSDGLVADAPPPSIDFGGSGRSLAIRNYHGDVQLENKTGIDEVEININSGGHVYIASDVTNGDIRLTGIMEVTDNSTGSANIDITHVIFPDQLQLASFEGMVHIDPVNGAPGIKFPQGTNQNPVSTIADAITIGAARGINSFMVHNTLVIDGYETIDGYAFVGANPLTSVVVLSSGCSTERTTFKNMIITGLANGPLFCRDVGLQALSGIGSDNFPTVFDRCILRDGTHTLKAGLSTPQNVHFIDCASGVPGDGYAVFDFNGATTSVAFRNFVGGLGIDNYTGGQDSTIGFGEGQLVLDTSCTSGIIRLDGTVELNDASGPSFTVDQRSHIHADVFEDAVWDADLEEHQDTTKFGGWVGSKLLSIAKFIGLK